ncbi:tetratricopeptide repeat protein [Pseudoduganella namucuonensis]|uniref:Sel1 repeat family protein n=1 Tax=Pseudoduganella namucuonensis TaxID=1035707 RepID=A0A1I7ING4_9BURK|nr:tetratricopeptide repeat protein [Pseudoduganella namucuonensis]SFU74471.1 hypothetical protein SAMN05216552_1008171 [Pseudoduganella namucuonensis]
MVFVDKTQLSLALVLAAPLFAQAQAPAQPQARAQAGAAASVTVSGQRGAAGDPRLIVAAKNRMLSRTLASSCGFMSGYSANDDDVMLRYMSDFNLEDSASNLAERFNEFGPLGDASNTPDATSIEDPLAATDPNAPAVACGPADRRFAAGINRIMRKDKTLAQAFAALDRDDGPGALALFKAAHDKIGYDAAALMLGKMHLYGMGTPRDTAQAIAWLRKVVDARYDPVADRLRFDPAHPDMINERAEAIMLLAKIHLFGIGVKKDAAEVVKWYAKAADVGYVPASAMLAQARLTGFGGPRDVARARGLLAEAGEAGYVPALYELGRLYYNGDDGVARDYKMAGAYFTAAAKAGHAGGLFAAARMYDLGQGVAPDQPRAIALYKQAALKGQPDAESALATYFYEGQLVPQDHATARKLFKEAAVQGQADAMFNLAVMSLEGQGGPKDVAMAYVWFSLAKASGHASADTALKAVAPRLTAQDQARVDAVLKPAAR